MDGMYHARGGKSMIRIAAAAADNVELAGLVGRLDAYLSELYPPDEIFGLDFSDPNVRDMVFAVAYDGERAIGCGAIRPLDSETAELKRFYVEPAARNRGVAGQLLRYLEQAAAERAYSRIRLETGAPQRESVAFYQKHGYRPIERFGIYADCASSLCYEKRIGAGV